MTQLTSEPYMLELLLHMKTVATSTMQRFRSVKYLPLIFHAVPRYAGIVVKAGKLMTITSSLQPLHLHIISEDLESKFMRRDRNWNGFTTAHAIPLDVIMERLKKGLPAREFEVEYYERAVEKPTHCHRCGIRIEISEKNIRKHRKKSCSEREPSPE